MIKKFYDNCVKVAGHKSSKHFLAFFSFIESSFFPIPPDVMIVPMTVAKKNGQHAPFDRDKLSRSILIATRKRPVEAERVDRMINGIVRRLESLGESDISSDTIGELVMEGLANLDQVAYVRFASVYRNFREARDFETFVGKMGGGIEDDLLE